MPICPKCNEFIDGFNHYQSGEQRARCTLSGNDKFLEYDIDEFQANSKTNDYECFKCGETLFTDEQKATKFLKQCCNCDNEFNGKYKLDVEMDDHYFCSESCLNKFKVKLIEESL